ncbi:MAG: DUF423 domain-containing protein [Marinobacter sp.]|uniref:DUF423 domain-containing protein n=1 Tax=Marinobacter sp. TaxID=50741 RepID=UPI0034A0910D
MLGALLILTAVMGGAFGAHALRGMVAERSLEVFQTGVQYQMIHGLGLILIAILGALNVSRRLLALAAGFLMAGVLMFSGSLYLLVLTDWRWVGPVTPVGGVCFMVGWVLIVIAGLRQGNGQESI